MPTQSSQNKQNQMILFLIAIILLSINPIIGLIIILKLFPAFAKGPKHDIFSRFNYEYFSDYSKRKRMDSAPATEPASQDNQDLMQALAIIPAYQPLSVPVKLKKHTKYLHIALNSTLEDAEEILSQLPSSDRILIEAGTPLIKIYGTDAIRRIRRMTPSGTYIIADNKCADLAEREVEMMANAGASAATCLGVAPVETIDSFIEACRQHGIDSMLDMMNVDNTLSVLKKLKELPDVVILHRGVDESEFSREKQIPYYQIKQIKGSYDVLVAVAGGDTIKEIQRAIFNDADIVVVWKNFYAPTSDTASLAQSFWREIV